MLFPEEDASLLKAWIIKRLENTSDADADVLAEYVLALLRHDGTVEDVRKLCEAEIPDFLKEDSSVFVSDVFNAIQYRSYLPGGGLPQQRQPTNLAGGPAASALAQGLPYDDAAPNASRKRSYHDRGDVEMRDAAEYYANGSSSGNRSFKQPRRGRGDSYAGYGRDSATGGGFSSVGPYRTPTAYGMPTAAAGAAAGSQAAAAAFDPSNPIGSLMRLQSMGVPLPQLPAFPGPPPAGGQQQQRKRQRCRDYDTKGYCARGNSCMYEHGTDSIFVPPVMPLARSPGNEEYDPTNAGMIMSQMNLPTPTQSSNQPFTLDPNNFQIPLVPHHDARNGFGGGMRPRFPPRKPRARAPFSAEGPVLDRTKSTIVVENIPEERFSEDEVRGFFAQFGNITEVSMRPYKHLAIVKFDSWNAANAAYRSPKVIFDNRFVKVYWYKDSDGEEGQQHQHGQAPGKNGAGPAREGSATTATSEIDMDEFLRKQEEAQRAFVEKQQKAAEIERRREELETKQKELLARQQAERQRLYARIAAISARRGEAGGPAGGEPGEGEEEEKKKKPGTTTQTEALRAQLAALEAEAKQLGIDPDAVGGEEEGGAGWGGGGAGYRGGYRGRGGGGYVPRGTRGSYVPRAGGYRGGGRGGRGGGGPAAYAAYSIDNRPKKVAVAGVDFTDTEKGEMLRQFLFGIGEFTDIQDTPAATTISFKDRKTAEKFFYGVPNKTIPGVEGQVELSWVRDDNAGSSTAPAASSPFATNGGSGGPAKQHAAGDAQKAPAGADKDVAMQEQHAEEQQVEMDYDVAGDDQWDIS